jgi:hypothetical protein
MSCMAQERTYLDTNIIFHRKFSKEDIIVIIESAIGHTFKYCSAFVVSEHKKVFLQTMRLLWTFFKENNGTEEVLECIKNHHWKSSQEKDRCIKIFNWITNYGSSVYGYAVAQLENVIFSYEILFFRDINVLESEVNCPLTRIKINSRKEIVNVSLKCPLRCSLSDFMQDWKESLIKVRKGIKNIAHLQLFGAILKRIDENPRKYDEGVCRTLADVIIVLEAPEGFLVCSNNEKDFKPICRVLEKRFLPIRY